MVIISQMMPIFRFQMMLMEEPIVALEQVTIRQGQRDILRDVNLRMSKGEFVYLVGKTGSGKSSLLKTLYGALPLESGRGVVAEFDLSRLHRRNIPHLRRKLGIIFQDFNLLEDRHVAENLRFVLRATGWKEADRMQNRIQEVLASVGLSDKADAMPYQLSGGEQQRVAIARGLLNDPLLIVADEPTGNLDPETSDDILLLLRRLAQEQGTAVLLATHDYRMLEQFPGRIVRCTNGLIYDDQELEM